MDHPQLLQHLNKPPKPAKSSMHKPLPKSVRVRVRPCQSVSVRAHSLNPSP